MIHFSLILHHNIGIRYAEEPFYGFVLPKTFFKMGTFSDPQHTHPGIFILESPPPPLGHTVSTGAGLDPGFWKGWDAM